MVTGDWGSREGWAKGWGGKAWDCERDSGCMDFGEGDVGREDEGTLLSY